MTLKPKKPTSFSISEKAHDLLAKLAEYHGLSKTAQIETLVRAEARKLGLE